MARKGIPRGVWTRKAEMTICHMRESGCPIKEIAAAVGKNYGAVAVRLSQLGATRKGDRPRRKPGELAAAVTTFFSGRRVVSDADAALALGVSRQNIHVVRKRLGIPSRYDQKSGGRKGGRMAGANRPKSRLARGKPGNRGSGGNNTPLTDDQKALADAFCDPTARKNVFKVIAHIAPRFPALSRDDLESAALLAVVAAARDYRPDGGAKFTTYAMTKIIGYARDAQRNLRPLGFRADNDDFPATVSLGAGPV